MATLEKWQRVLLVDDHPIIREGLRSLFAGYPEFVICGEASGVEDGLERIRELRPDAAVVDISLGRESGLELIARARREAPSLVVVAFSMLDEMTYAERALRQGASGYVMKQEPPDRLMVALRRALAGKVTVSASVRERLLTTLGRQGDEVRYSVDRLTDRELEIFRLLGLGLRSTEIAKRLGISPKTIETHRVRIKAKLGVETASELVIQASSWVREGPVKQ
jgi:DNA-binding NarL/FixJ family response regulator